MVSYILFSLFITALSLKCSLAKLDIDEKIYLDKNGNVQSTGIINFYNPAHVIALLCNYSGLKMKHSDLFNVKYFDFQNKIDCNLYLNEKKYAIIKDRLGLVKIKFIKSNLKDLKLNENYDYMFLSNISDYINTFYSDDYLVNYKKLIFKFLEKVKIIYFAYIYDVASKEKRSSIDNIESVKELFGDIKVKKFKSALLNVKTDAEDAVLIKEE